MDLSFLVTTCSHMFLLLLIYLLGLSRSSETFTCRSTKRLMLIMVR